MTTVITLPKDLIKKGDLVLMPRSDYEELLRTAKEQTELKQGLRQSLKEAQTGKIVGPFKNLKALMKSLTS